MSKLWPLIQSSWSSISIAVTPCRQIIIRSSKWGRSECQLQLITTHRRLSPALSSNSTKNDSQALQQESQSMVTVRASRSQSTQRNLSRIKSTNWRAVPWTKTIRMNGARVKLHPKVTALTRPSPRIKWLESQTWARCTAPTLAHHSFCRPICSLRKALRLICTDDWRKCPT